MCRNGANTMPNSPRMVRGRTPQRSKWVPGTRSTISSPHMIASSTPTATIPGASSARRGFSTPDVVAGAEFVTASCSQIPKRSASTPDAAPVVEDGAQLDHDHDDPAQAGPYRPPPDRHVACRWLGVRRLVCRRRSGVGHGRPRADHRPRHGPHDARPAARLLRHVPDLPDRRLRDADRRRPRRPQRARPAARRVVGGQRRQHRVHVHAEPRRDVRRRLAGDRRPTSSSRGSASPASRARRRT